MAKNTSGIFLLQLVTAFFFLLLGLYGILPTVNESIFSISDGNSTIEIVFGIIELACAVILIAGMFLGAKRSTLSVAGWVIFFFWAARIVYTKVILGVAYRGGQLYFAPSLSSWLLILSVELIVLISVYQVARSYKN